MECGQKPLGGRWHQYSCTCIKSFVSVGLVNSRWLRLEYTYVERPRRFFVFTQRALRVCTLLVSNGNWRGLPVRNFLCMCKNGGVTSHPKDFAHTALVLEKKNKVRYFLNAPRISMSRRALSLCFFRKSLYSFIISDVIIRIKVFILVSYCLQENSLWAYM